MSRLWDVTARCTQYFWSAEKLRNHSPMLNERTQSPPIVCRHSTPPHIAQGDSVRQTNFDEKLRTLKILRIKSQFSW